MTRIRLRGKLPDAYVPFTAGSDPSRSGGPVIELAAGGGTGRRRGTERNLTQIKARMLAKHADRDSMIR
jgi:hypothetical protein